MTGNDGDWESGDKIIVESVAFGRDKTEFYFMVNKYNMTKADFEAFILPNEAFVDGKSYVVLHTDKTGKAKYCGPAKLYLEDGHVKGQFYQNGGIVDGNWSAYGDQIVMTEQSLCKYNVNSQRANFQLNKHGYPNN